MSSLEAKFVSCIAFGAAAVFLLLPATLSNDPASSAAFQAASWRPEISSPVTRLLNFDSREFPETVLRPLLSPTRRPPGPRPPEPEPVEEAVQPESAPEPTPSAPPVSLVLKGVLVDADRQAALIQSQAHPDGIWLEVGKEVDGWMLRQISLDNVAIESNGQIATLPLYVDNNSVN